jgi:hypothetical protein
MSHWLARAGRSLRLLVVTPYPTDGTTVEQRHGLQMLWWDTLLASMSIAFVTDFETLYLLKLGASSQTIGARASIVAGAALLAPLVGAWLVSRSGKRKIWVLLSGGGVARVALLLSALAPVLFMRAESAIAYIMVLTAIRSFMGSVTLPPFNSLFGDLVPASIRGRVMGVRMMAASVVTVLMLPIAGWLINTADRRTGRIRGHCLLRAHPRDTRSGEHATTCGRLCPGPQGLCQGSRVYPLLRYQRCLDAWHPDLCTFLLRTYGREPGLWRGHHCPACHDRNRV